MCRCSVGIIIMKHAVFVSSHPLSLSFSLSFFSSLVLFVPAFIHLQIPLYYFFLPLLQPVTTLSWTFPITLSCLIMFFSLPSHPFSSLQRCRCHQCFVSPRSESYRFRSGNSTHRVLSWSPSTLSSIPVALVTHTSSASSTGQCWSERRRGTQTKHTLVFSISATFIK